MEHSTDKARAEAAGARSALDEPTTETKTAGGRSIHVSPGYGVALSTVGALEDTSALIESGRPGRQLTPAFATSSSMSPRSVIASVGSPPPIGSPLSQKPISGFQRLQDTRERGMSRVDNRPTSVAGAYGRKPSSVRLSVTRNQITAENPDMYREIQVKDVHVDTSITYSLHRTSQMDRNLKKLKQTLERWMNRYLQRDQMAVRDILSEMYDGELLLAFLSKVTGKPVQGQNEDLSGGNLKSSIQRVTACLNFVLRTLKLPLDPSRYTVEGIVMNNYGAILSLLVDVAYILGCPYIMPQNVVVAVIRTEDDNGTQKSRTVLFHVTPTEHFEQLSKKVLVDESLRVDIDESEEKTDVFDEVSESAEKMAEMTQLLLEFVNSQLEIINVHLDSLEQLEPLQVIFLLGILGNFFVPTKLFHLPATDFHAQLENAKVALMLMTTLDVPTTRVQASDLVNHDLRTVSRCVYFIFKRFRTGNEDIA